MRHELRLTSFGLRAALPAAALLAGIGGVVGGGRGAASAALGASLVAANHLAAAGSVGWARTLGPGVVAAGYAFFVVRMFAVFAAFAVFAQLKWVHQPLLAAAFCAVLVTSLLAECLAYARGSYVPRWRASR